MNPKGLAWGIVLSGLMWAAIIAAMVGCSQAPRHTQYESDPNHYPYYRPAKGEGESSFYPRNNPGVIVGGPRDGSIVHNGKVYNEDGTVDYLPRR